MSSQRLISIAFTIASLISANAAASHRVLIPDAQLFDDAGDDAAKLTSILADGVGEHSGYTAVSGKDAAAASKAGCMADQACRAKVAGDAKADQVLVAKLSKDGRKYVLDTSLYGADGTAAGQHSESMKSLKSVKLNADICLKELLKDSDSAPAAAATPTPTAPAAPVAASGAKKRVLVLDSVAFEGAGEEADRLTDMVVDALGTHPEFNLISDEETQAVEKTHESKQPDCLKLPTCIKDIGAEEKADLVVTIALQKEGKKYVLDMSLLNGSESAVGHHSESMKSLKSMKLNADLCLKDLFKFP